MTSVSQRLRWVIVAALVLSVAARAGEAQEPSQGPPGGEAPPGGPGAEVRRAEPVVVTATRSEVPLEQIGASVTVIPAEVIDVREYRAVEEALRPVPGVDVQRSGGLGKLTEVRIRGAEPQQTQVLIDGVRVKSTTLSEFDFADLPVDNIERIEVLRGPQSTLYGADAIGGVINIITKRGRGTPSGFVDIEGGNYDTVRERFASAGAIGPWSYSVGVSHLDFGGQFRNDDHSLWNANGQLAYALPNRGELSLVGRYTDGHIGIPFKTVFPDFDVNREEDDRTTLLSLEWYQPWVAWYEHRLRLSTVETDSTFRDPPDPGETGPGFRSDIVSRRREAEWLNYFRIANVDTVTLGLEYRHEEGENQGTFSQSTDTWSLWLQNELRLFDRLFLTGGVRHDDNSAFGAETTGRAAVSFLVKETDTRFKASWGQGFRAPTFNDLFFPAFPPCPAFGNPHLRPETSESWDAGIEQALWRRRVRVAATYFRNDFSDLIQSTLIDPVNSCFQARNIGQARSQGVEVEASVAPVNALFLSLAYTYTDTKNLVTGTPLPRFAPDRWAFTLTYEPLRELKLTGEIFIVSSQFEAPGQPRNPGYTVVNAVASYRLPWKWGFLSAVVLHVKVTNLFDEHYSEVAGFPALGTYVVGGIRASF